MSIQSLETIPSISHYDCVIDIIQINLKDLNDIKKDQKNSIGCCHSRLNRNLGRVFLAGSLSTAGACLSGYLPTIEGIIIGGALGGIGNGLSTMLAWEKKRVRLIQHRMIENFPLLVKKVYLMEAKLFLLNKNFKNLSLENNEKIEVLPEGNVNSHSVEQQADQPWYWRTKNRRNFSRVFIAGALSAAGGWLGGFEPTTWGILGGGVLSGVGNAVSTWLAFEQHHDKITRKSALEILPELVSLAEGDEKKLNLLIIRIQALHPDISMNFDSNFSLSLVLEKEEKENKGCLTNTRTKRNFLYVNTAGWLSAAGGWIGGFVPSTPGILVGGTIGAVANSISTWLAWEKSSDQEIERIALQDFPRLAAKIDEISQQIIKLTTGLADYEKLISDSKNSFSLDEANSKENLLKEESYESPLLYGLFEEI